MHKPLWIAVMALLLAPPAFSQIRNTAPPPLKGVQPQQPPSKVPIVAPPLRTVATMSSTITGMVSWDATKIQPSKTGGCQGLQIYAAQGSFPQVNPTPVGQTKLLPYQLQGSSGKCPFEIDGAPVGVGLTVYFKVLSGAFQPAVVAFGQSGQFVIPGGACGGPGHEGRTTVTGIVVCGNTASSVNLQF